MLKILLCCGGGMSSSVLVKRVKDEIIKEHLENEVSITFSAFTLAQDTLQNYDIIMACPHLQFSIQKFLKEHQGVDVPIYIIPPKIYGLIKLDVIMKDAQDIIEGYKQNPFNPFHFDDEPTPLFIKRSLAHRDTK